MFQKKEESWQTCQADLDKMKIKCMLQGELGILIVIDYKRKNYKDLLFQLLGRLNLCKSCPVKQRKRN